MSTTNKFQKERTDLIFIDDLTIDFDTFFSHLENTSGTITNIKNSEHE